MDMMEELRGMGKYGKYRALLYTGGGRNAVKETECMGYGQKNRA
jgi:hypothetical protein